MDANKLINTAAGIMNCPAFWNSLSKVSQSLVREVNTAIDQKVPIVERLDYSELRLWKEVSARYVKEVIEPYEKQRLGMQATLARETAALCTECGITSTQPVQDGWYNPSICSGKCFDAREAKVNGPQTGWSDTDIFEVNYPDNIQVQIDRTNPEKIGVRFWQIGKDEPFHDQATFIPQPNREDQKFLFTLQKCLEPDYADVRFYEDYDPAYPEDATFIIAGPWTIRKEGTAFVLEATVQNYGGREEPPSQEPVDVDRFTNVWELASRILLEDARLRIESRLEMVQVEAYQ